MADASDIETSAPAAGSSPFTPEMIAETFGGEPPAPTETGAVEAEAQAEPTEPETKAKSPAERILAATRAEQKAIREREARIAREREAEAKLEARAREIEEREKRLKAIEDGTDPDAVREHLERLAKVAKPEAAAERKLTEHEQKIKDLEDKLAARERALQQAEVEEQTKAAKQAFIDDVAKAADKYPHLTQEFSEQEAANMGLQSLYEVIGFDRDKRPVTRLQAFSAKHGRGPTHEEIAEHLDAIAKQRIEARASASWRKNGTALPGSQPTTGEKQTPSATGNSPRTLSRADTSQRAAAPRTNAWSQEAADEESLRILAKAVRKG